MRRGGDVLWGPRLYHSLIRKTRISDTNIRQEDKTTRKDEKETRESQDTTRGSKERERRLSREMHKAIKMTQDKDEMITTQGSQLHKASHKDKDKDEDKTKEQGKQYDKTRQR